MKKIFVILLLMISLFGFNCGDGEKISNKKVENSNEVDFCALMINPESYKSKVIQTKAVIRGYHSFILYNESCCEVDKVVNAQGIDFEKRRKMFEKINEIYSGNAKSDVSGEVVVLVKLEDNDIKPSYSGDTMPKYKFTILEIKSYQPNQDLMKSCLSDYGSITVEKQ